MRYSKILLFFILIYMIYQCKDESTVNRSYPRVNTLGIIEISESGVQVSGQIYEAEGMKISDHGFVYASLSDPYYNDVAIEESELFFEKLSLGEVSGNQTYEAKLENNLINGVKYLLKAYATTENYTIYGDSIIFTSKGGQLPIITKIEPDTAYFGDTISIHGKHFSMQNHSNMVWFGSNNCKSIISNDSLMVTTVPDILNEHSYTIKTSVNNITSNTYPNFIINSPVIDLVSPENVWSNKKVKLIGRYVTSIKDIEVNDQKVNRYGQYFDNEESVSFEFPTKQPKGAADLKVFYLDTFKIFKSILNVEHPYIDSIYPLEIAEDTVVTIVGKHLGKIDQFNIMSHGQKLEESSTIIKLKMQYVFNNRYPSGKYEIYTISYDKKMEWLPPVINFIDKKECISGDTIIVVGKRFAYSSEVYIGGLKAKAIKHSKDEIECIVPDLDYGSYTISVITGSGVQEVFYEEQLSILKFDILDYERSVLYRTAQFKVSTKNLPKITNPSALINGEYVSCSRLLDGELIVAIPSNTYLESPLTLEIVCGAQNSKIDLEVDYLEPWHIEYSINATFSNNSDVVLLNGIPLLMVKNSETQNNEFLQLVNGQWVFYADVHNNISVHSYFSYAGELFIIWKEDNHLIVESYNEAEEKWIERLNYSFNETQFYPLFYMKIEGEIFIGSSSTLLQFFPDQNTYIEKNKIATSHREIKYPLVFTYKGIGYLGFYKNIGRNFEENELWKYDPITDTWDLIGQMPLHIYDSSTAYVKDDNVYIASKGYRLTSEYNQFSPGNGTWRSLFPPPGGRDLISFWYNDKLYIGVSYYNSISSFFSVDFTEMEALQELLNQ